MSDPADATPPGQSSRIRRRRIRSAEMAVAEIPVFVGSFIVQADGAIEHASVESRAWLAVRGFDAAMTRFVASLASPTDGRASDNPFAPFAEASAVRLIGADSPLRYHVRVRPIFDAEPQTTDDPVASGRR